MGAEGGGSEVEILLPARSELEVLRTPWFPEFVAQPYHPLQPEQLLLVPDLQQVLLRFEEPGEPVQTDHQSWVSLPPADCPVESSQVLECLDTLLGVSPQIRHRGVWVSGSRVSPGGTYSSPIVPQLFS